MYRVWVLGSRCRTSSHMKDLQKFPYMVHLEANFLLPSILRVNLMRVKVGNVFVSVFTKTQHEHTTFENSKVVL